MLPENVKWILCNIPHVCKMQWMFRECSEWIPPVHFPPLNFQQRKGFYCGTPYPGIFYRYHPWWFRDFIFTQGIYMAVEYEISEIELPTSSCNTYYICTCRWHSYFRYSATNMFVHIELILMPQNLWILLRCLYEHSSCIFWRFCTSLRHALHPDIQPPIYLWTSHKSSGSSAFSKNIYWASALSFSDIPHISKTCIIFTSDISDIQLPCAHLAGVPDASHFFRAFTDHQGCFVWIFWTLPGHVVHLAYLFRVFRTFSSSFMCAHALEVPHFFRTFTRALWLFFFSDIPDTLRTCITVDIFILNTSDTQHLIYLCRCSGSSAFFHIIYPSTRDVFFRIFQTLSGHVSHFAYLFRIFRTFSSSFICGHTPPVPHFFRTLARGPGLFFSNILDTVRTCITFGTFISDNVVKKCGTSRACAQINELLNVWSI